MEVIIAFTEGFLGASLEEDVYGLRRFSTKTNSTISRTQRMASLLELVILPYTLRKLDSFHAALPDRQPSLFIDDEDPCELELHGPRERFKRLFQALYPRLKFLLQILKTGYQLAYIFEQTRYPSLWMYLTGMELRRANPLEIVRVSAV